MSDRFIKDGVNPENRLHSRTMEADMKSKSCNRILTVAALLAVSAFAATTMNYHLANTYKFGAAARGW